ncbi:MAG: chromophore lyase CpcT/CpeT [Alphaproteobacteria bacterium]
MHKVTFAAVSGLVLCFAPVSHAQTPDQNGADAQILKRDFSRMMDWFPGRYDNQEQVYFENNLDVDEGLRHGRIHHLFVPADLPNFPGETFYIQQYQNDDPKDVYRQRIYSFEPDFEENATRLTIYIPKDAKAILDAHEDMSKLDGLKPSDFTVYPGCEVYWKYQNDFYHGYMKEGTCKTVSKRSGKTLVFTDDLQLSKSGIWIRDEAVDTEGNYIYGNKAGVHHKNNRARMFNCWVSPQKENGEYGFYNNIKLHDQGGRVWLEGEGHERVGLKMRNVVWPMGRNRASLVLYAYRGDEEDKAVSYTWTAPDGDRLAMNLRWLQASCTLGDEEIFPGINKKTGSGN